MKMSHVWKSGSRKKKTKPTYKIRWEVLGLSGPDQAPTPSMDAIRSEVSQMATQGLAERVPARSMDARIDGRAGKRRRDAGQ